MATNIVSEYLAGRFNYDNWSACMKNYLLAHDLREIIEANTESPNPEEGEAEFKAWRKKNAAAIHAIQISCLPHILSGIRNATSAKLCWDILANLPDELNPPVNQAIEVNPNIQFHQQVEEEENVNVRFWPLREAIEIGDLSGVKRFLHVHKGALQKKLKDFGGRTALHLATLTGNLKTVETLVDLMSNEDLEIVDNNHETALVFAAVIGATSIAECLVKKNEKLVTIPGKYDLPVIVACNNGHQDTARYLYSLTPFELLLPQNGAYGSLLLHVSIFRKMFDISLDLLRRCPSLATTVNHLNTNPLIEISGLADLFPSGNRYVFWKRWIYSRIHVQLRGFSSDVQISIPQHEHMEQNKMLVQGCGQLRHLGSQFLQIFGVKQIYDRKLSHAYALELLRCMSEHISTIDDAELANNRVYEAFFRAIEHGVIEFVIAIIKANPSLLTVVDKNLKGILMLAVQHRQEKVFSLVYVLDTRKYMLLSGLDAEKNNMLHIAAKLAPPDRLARISGAALQMQRELQWYKEVESIVNPSSKEYTNIYGQKARQIFSDSHKQMVADGEKWMKETATSCTVVGALIITIMFTAAFTVPGGNVQETGFPIFLHQKSFKVFIISDAVSLFASSTSVLMFLGMLTSRYGEEDFLKSLPTKLMIGLSTLFISIAAMMVAFCATLMIMLRGQLELVIPIVLLATVPVTLFILLQFPLLVEIFVSTYGPGFFDKKMKYWY